MAEVGDGTTRSLVVGVTIGLSALTLLRGQLAWLRQAGWEVTLVSTPDVNAEAAALREGVDLVGIPMQRGVAPIRDFGALVRWIRLLRARRPDATSVGTPKAALLGVVASALVRVPRRLYIVRGLRLEGARGPLVWLLWAMEWLTMSLATDVIFVSPSLAREACSRRLLPEGKSWVIGAGSSNGVDAEAVEARTRAVDRAALREEMGFVPAALVVGFIGRIARDKGVDTLIRALNDESLSSDVRGLLIGPVENGEIGAQLASLDAAIKVLPWTDDVWGLLPAMDVLCLPTLREGFPNVVLEAAAAGVPTITTRATGAIDSVIDGETGLLIDIGDEAALVEHLRALDRDRATLARMGRAARERAARDFRPETVWAGLAEILVGAEGPVHARRANRHQAGQGSERVRHNDNQKITEGGS